MRHIMHIRVVVRIEDRVTKNISEVVRSAGFESKESRLMVSV